MVEKEFNSDEIIETNKAKPKYASKKDFIYIDYFKKYRVIFEYAFATHWTMQFYFWLNDKYQGKFFDSRVKIKKVCLSFGVFYFGLYLIDDLIYSLFRRDRTDGFVTKFIQYQKICASNFRNYLSTMNSREVNFYKISSEKKSNNDTSNDGANKLQKIHSQLIEIENLEKELKERIKNTPIQDISYTKILKDINLKRENKKIIIEKLKGI